MAEPLISFVVEQLLNVLVKEASFLSEVRGQVEEMKNELVSMRTYLIDADRRRGEGDQSVTKAVVEIRELAYEAEEVIARFVVKVVGGAESSSGSRKKAAIYLDFKSCFSLVKTIGTRHNVGKHIEEINKKIVSLTGRLQRYEVKPLTVGRTPAKIVYPTAVEGIVVGLESQVRMMVDHLKDETREGIVSIYGMGGLGKTTFSKKIVQHREIKQHFSNVAWTCISQQFDKVQIWRDILLQFNNTEEEKKRTRKLTESELVRELHSTQKEKKCLVVLDDIWEQKHWRELCCVFPTETTTGSKIMITTRNKKVVSRAEISCFLYELPFLKPEQSQELLEKKLSPGTQEMKNIIKELVGRCGGLPLAVVLLGGILAEDKTLEEWQRVREDLINRLDVGNDHEWGVSQVLALSYHELPYHLKACFLYLSLFPEDYDIDATPLLQMWIAEGFVTAPPGRNKGAQTMLDIGFGYLNELVNRCMVQANLTRFTGKVKSFHLHDLMRTFCLSKAQENFYEDFRLHNSSPNTIRRLAVYLKRLPLVITTPSGQHSHVRSCLVHRNQWGYWDTINSLLKGFKFIKVLYLADFPFKDSVGELSEDVGKLFYLRQLRVPRTLRLPSSLENLILLETLDLRVVKCYIPDVLWKFKQLRHLYLPQTFEESTKLSFDGLSKLEILVNVDSRYCDVGSLSTLVSIRKVTIRCNSTENLATIFESPMFRDSDSSLRQSSFTLFIEYLKNEEEFRLLSQVLACPRVIKISLRGPSYRETLLHELNTKITKICLIGCQLNEDPMTSLGKLPYLRRLTLDGAYAGKKMVCLASQKTSSSNNTCNGGFPQLTQLYLRSLSNLSEWEIEDGALPCLSVLSIWNCMELKEIPDGLKSIRTLEKVRITCVNESLGQSLNGGDDFRKIQHVPTVKLNSIE